MVVRLIALKYLANQQAIATRGSRRDCGAAGKRGNLASVI